MGGRIVQSSRLTNDEVSSQRRAVIKRRSSADDRRAFRLAHPFTDPLMNDFRVFFEGTIISELVPPLLNVNDLSRAHRLGRNLNALQNGLALAFHTRELRR